MLIKINNKDFATLKGKEQRAALQEAFETMNGTDMETFIDDNIGEASSRSINDEYRDRDLDGNFDIDSDDFDIAADDRYKDTKNELGANQRFKDLQTILYGFLHYQQLEGVYLPLDKALEAVRELYSFVGKSQLQ